MLTTTHTADRILNLMKDGKTKLVIHCWYVGYDSYSFVTGATLERDGKSIKLSHWEDAPGGTPPCSEDGPRGRTVLDVPTFITQHPDIREGYAGYQGEGRGHWQRVYEHKSAPKPRWITEQWGWDENGQIEAR